MNDHARSLPTSLIHFCFFSLLQRSFNSSATLARLFLRKLSICGAGCAFRCFWKSNLGSLVTSLTWSVARHPRVSKTSYSDVDFILMPTPERTHTRTNAWMEFQLTINKTYNQFPFPPFLILFRNLFLLVDGVDDDFVAFFSHCFFFFFIAACVNKFEFL